MDIAASLAEQHERLGHACARSGRDASEVRLVAVSKAHPVEAIIEAYDAGQRAFGESYARELDAKLDAWPDDRPGAEWHFIGHLQSNKARDVVGRVACIHSVDRPSLVRELARRASSEQDVLVEVNVADEASKHGCTPEAAPRIVESLLRAENLRPVGLMTIAPYADDAEDVRPVFVGLRRLRDEIRRTLPAAAAADFGELSMGMSGDAEVAVEEGATIVRVGTAIFGQRSAG